MSERSVPSVDATAASTTDAAADPVERPEHPGALIPLQYHFNMLNDTARMDGFAAAIAVAVQPGMTVLELGGGTGVLSWMAARAGARKVYCVEKLPEMQEAARTALRANPDGERVEVVAGDAFTYLPPEPVDVVICEMLHTGLLREHQTDVLRSFKQRYQAAYGPKLPTFIPEATLQAFQPINFDFRYHGYLASTPAFVDGRGPQDRTIELGDPVVWQAFAYADDIPTRCIADHAAAIHTTGTLNALRIVTKSILAITPAGTTADWIMHYLVVPTPHPIEVLAGDDLAVQFAYRPGDELEALCDSIRLEVFAHHEVGLFDVTRLRSLQH